MPSPQDIARQFSLQATQYGQVSSIQEKLANRLWSALHSVHSCPFSKIVDIGAGTGHLSMLLAQGNPKELHLLDLSSKMLTQASHRLQKHFPDLLFFPEEHNAETWVPTGGKFDLIASSAAIQWFKDFPGFCQKCADWLKPEGLVAFGSFGDQSLQELSLAYLQATGQKLKVGTQMFLSGELSEQVEASGFSILKQGSETANSYHEGPRSILKDLKSMGVTGGNQAKGITRSQLHTLEAELERTSRTKDGRYALTWKLEWVVAKALSK